MKCSKISLIFYSLSLQLNNPKIISLSTFYSLSFPQHSFLLFSFFNFHFSSKHMSFRSWLRYIDSQILSSNVSSSPIEAHEMRMGAYSFSWISSICSFVNNILKHQSSARIIAGLNLIVSCYIVQFLPCQ